MDQSFFVIIIISLGFSFLFSGLEIAFVSSDKLHIELKGLQSNLTGKILAKFQNSPSQFIGTTLIGNTLALVVYGIFMAKILEPVIFSSIPPVLRNEATVMIIQTLIATLIVLITAEFTPKSIFMINPNRMLTFFAIPMAAIYYMLYPVTYVVIAISKLIFKKAGLSFSENKPAFGLTDLQQFVKRIQTGEQEEVEVDTKMFHNAVELKSVKVRECMVPRTELTAADINESIEHVRKIFVESGHTKILIYKDSIDDVVGFVHSLELFKKPESLEHIISPIIIVPETMLANELMVQFINEHKSLALVVDEYGGTSGIVSMEDIIEEIFGEIQDEHDEEELIEEQLDERTFLFSARHEIDYLNDKYGWEIPTGDFETLGGLILHERGDLPKPGEEIDIYPFTLRIMSMEDIRISTVRISIDPNYKFDQEE